MASAVVLGGGPASREVPLLDPQRNTQPLNALVFNGGSAYGMAAADGVMSCLDEQVKHQQTAQFPEQCNDHMYEHHNLPSARWQ